MPTLRRAGPVAGLIAAGLALLSLATGYGAETSRDADPAGPVSTTDARGSTTAPEPPEVADPATVSLPRLGIGADLDPLDLDEDGVLIPPDYGRAGWYAAGPEPGEVGPAVVAGHVDSATGPDVFAALGQARAGDRVRVGLVDGGTVTFRVTGVAQFAQDDFPTERVYGETADAALRLITCGGEYDRTAGRYRDNVVVFAEVVR